MTQALMNSANVTLPQAEEMYRVKREHTHRVTVMNLRQADAAKFSLLTITPITPHALNVFRTQWNHSARRVDWDWGGELDIWRRKRPSHWEMAVWHKQTLCGLVLGGPSRRRQRLYIEGIEANPEGNPYKTQMMLVALLASEQYAVSIGCCEVWAVEPPDGLLDQYAKAGYNLRLPNKFVARILRLTRFAVKQIGS